MKGKRAAIILIIVIIAAGVGWYLFNWFSPELNQQVAVPSILNDDNTNNTNMDNSNGLKLTSAAFKDGDFIPSKYTCDQKSVSPPLEISGVPAGAKTLVLVMDDPDVPKTVRPDGVYDHWVLYNIPPTATSFAEGRFQGNAGNNGSGVAQYAGPCPPTQYQPTTHRYFFKLFATDLPTLDFIKVPTKAQVLTAIQGHIVAEAQLIGLYDRTKNK